MTAMYQLKYVAKDQEEYDPATDEWWDPSYEM